MMTNNNLFNYLKRRIKSPRLYTLTYPYPEKLNKNNYHKRVHANIIRYVLAAARRMEITRLTYLCIVDIMHGRPVISLITNIDMFDGGGFFWYSLAAKKFESRNYRVEEIFSIQKVNDYELKLFIDLFLKTDDDFGHRCSPDIFKYLIEKKRSNE